MHPVNLQAKFEVRSFTRSWDNSAYLKTLGSPWIRRSGLFKVTDFGTNRKRVCDFLLVHSSNLGPILHRFGDIAGFLRSRVTSTPIPSQFWGCSRCTRWPMLGSARAEAFSCSAVKLFSKNSNLCDHDTWTSHTETDRRTDRQTIYDRNTALCTKVHRAVKT